MKRRTINVIVLLGLGLIIILFLFNIIGFQRIVSSLRKLNMYYYLIVISLVVGGSFLWAMRWGIFVKKTNPEVPNIELFKMMLIGQSVNNLTPIVKMGGEVSRVYLLNKKFKIKGKEGFASVASDLTLEFIVDGIVVMIAMVLLLIFTNPPTWIFIAILIFALMSSLIIFIIMDIYYGLSIVNRIVVWICEKLESVKKTGIRYLRKVRSFPRTLQERSSE